MRDEIERTSRLIENAVGVAPRFFRPPYIEHNDTMHDLTDLCFIYGFDLSDLGGNTFAINGIPTGIEGIDPVMLLRRMVTDATAQGRGVAEELHSAVALSLARSTAVPYGQVLSNEEMDNLINALFACSNVNYTPDGKPVITILPQSDIDKLFS